MTKSPMPRVAVSPVRGPAFEVMVRDGGGESRHRVTVSARDTAWFAELGADPAVAVEAAMRFLLDREPKEQVLAAFDIAVIRRYFPEFDDAFPGYLARVRGEADRSS
jgi:hypothetical protein